jgi:hypothetical protein
LEDITNRQGFLVELVIDERLRSEGHRFGSDDMENGENVICEAGLSSSYRESRYSLLRLSFCVSRAEIQLMPFGPIIQKWLYATQQLSPPKQEGSL